MITIIFWVLLTVFVSTLMTLYKIFWFLFVPLIWLKDFLFWETEKAHDWIDAKLPWLVAWIDWALGERE